MAPRASTLLAIGLAAGGALALLASETIVRGTAPAPGSCDAGAVPEGRCLFEGAPLQLAGTPVFVEKFDHAFLATSAPLVFVDAGGRRWTAPPQTLTDGASIPAIFETVIGDRQSRDVLLAAALHDAYCGVGNEALETYRTRSWAEVHRMFYEALVVSGTPPAKAKVMFAAVYLGGPRWDESDRALDGVPVEDLLRELDWCRQWIEQSDPGIAEIEAWMVARETALRDGTATRPAVLDAA